MNRVLLKKCAYEARMFLVAATAAMYAFCWLRVWIVSFIPMGRFQTILEQFREFERFLPVSFDELFTYSGRIALTFDELIVVMCMSVWAIGRGSDCVSGELGRGTMEMLLAQPLGRLQVMLTQAVVTVLGAAVLASAAWFGICTGIATTSVTEFAPGAETLPLFGFNAEQIPNALDQRESTRIPMSEKVDRWVFLPATLNLFCLGFFLAGLTTLMSSWDRYRWRTIGIVSTIYVLQLILKIVGLAVDQYAWMKKLSFFTAYEPERFVSVAVRSPEQAWDFLYYEAGQFVDLGSAGYNLILVGLGVAGYAAAAWVFCRRDLPAPL